MLNDAAYSLLQNYNESFVVSFRTIIILAKKDGDGIYTRY